MSSLEINKKAVTVKSIIAVIAVASAVILPQIFHAVGTISGTGAAMGAAFLPMHIPVLLAGFLGGPIAGLVSGILSPIISFGISGMPTSAMLPYMIIELAVYGLVSGILSKSKINTFFKLVITQVAGRLVRAGAVLIAIYAFGNTQLTIASISAFVTAGLFGIILQWAFIPLFADRMEGLKKSYE